MEVNRLHSVLRTRFQADETVKSPVMDNTNPDPKSREDLETLIDQSRHYAKHMLQTTGSVPPTLMALTPEGLMMFVPSELEDTDAKDKFANTGRLLAVGYKASAVVMILESWATFPKRPGLPLPEGPPSQSPDRKEVVVLMGETRDTRAQQFLFIQRNSSKNFTGFGTSLLPQFDQLEGRFAQMMPPKVPNDNDALMARTLLTAMGVNMTNHGANPMWN